MYSIAHLPLRKAIKPGTNTKVAATWTPEELTAVDALRDEFVARIDRLNEAFGKDQHRSVVGKADVREEVLTTLAASLERYAEHLCAFVAKHQNAAQLKYYFWGASVTERMNHAFADFRYELLNCYTCVGLVYHEAARFLLEVPPGAPMTEAMEKEGYADLCVAAGYVNVAVTLAKEMSTSPLPEPATHSMLEESKSVFLECVRDLMLEEAQWVGMEKAMRNELNKNKEIVPKLSHRALTLANSAVEGMTKQMTSSAPLFKQLVSRLQLKLAVLEALVYVQTAPCRFDKSPSEALWFSKTAEMNLSQVHALRGKLVSSTDPSSKRFGEWVVAQCKRVEGSVDRIRQMNSLVTREKVGEGPFALPPPQELARVKPICLPCPLPSTTAKPPEAAPPTAPPPTV